MSDDQEHKPKLTEAEVANIDAITARVESGQPILNFMIEPPFNCTVESNMLHIDAPCLGFGLSNTAAVVRLSLSAGAVAGLRDYLNKLDINVNADGTGAAGPH